jgi:hypothetical protein
MVQSLITEFSANAAQAHSGHTNGFAWHRLATSVGSSGFAGAAASQAHHAAKEAVGHEPSSIAEHVAGTITTSGASGAAGAKAGAVGDKLDALSYVGAGTQATTELIGGGGGRHHGGGGAQSGTELPPGLQPAPRTG